MIRLTLLYLLALAAFVLLVDVGALRDIALYLNQLPMLDKAVHFIMFGLLALLANASFLESRRWSFVGAVATGSMLVLTVSTLEELSNLLVEWRTCSLADLAANYLGIVCLGVLPLVAWKRSQPPTSTSAGGNS